MAHTVTEPAEASMEGRLADASSQISLDGASPSIDNHACVLWIASCWSKAPASIESPASWSRNCVSEVVVGCPTPSVVRRVVRRRGYCCCLQTKPSKPRKASKAKTGRTPNPPPLCFITIYTTMSQACHSGCCYSVSSIVHSLRLLPKQCRAPVAAVAAAAAAARSCPCSCSSCLCWPPPSSKPQRHP